MKECAWAAAGVLAVVVACGKREAPPESPVLEEKPADAVLRIATRWQSRGQDKGFRSAPSPIAVIETLVVDDLELAAGHTAREVITGDETFRMRDGAVYRCKYRVDLTVRAQFGRRNEEPAVQIDRPAATAERQCDAPGFPEPTAPIPSSTARFVLTGDQLVAFEPATERRTFIPAQ